MTYQFNPHAHVKIWLSKDKDSFLNLENILRLLTVRDNNPNDTIHFVYDSLLLSEQAQRELAYFCKKCNLHPVDVRSDVFPVCKTENEKKLIELYENEILHIHEGGNLAAASDILRWLSPVYERGTYTDFDTYLNTSSLPQFIPVEKPLLFHIGSIIHPDGLECIALNTDTIAVIDSQAASEQINTIQEDLIKACKRQPQTPADTTISQRLAEIAAQYKQYKLNPEALTVANYNLVRKLAELSAGKTIVETRQAILSLTLQQLSVYMTSDDDMPDEIRSQLLKESVIYTTGPGVIPPKNN